MHVDEDKDRIFLAHRVDRLLAGLHSADDVAGVREDVRYERADLDVVFDNENRMSTLTVPA